jgi:hypothetical protein
MRYRVTWGDLSDTIEANTSADAWAKFCERREEVSKFPNLHSREIQPEPVTTEVKSDVEE